MDEVRTASVNTGREAGKGGRRTMSKGQRLLLTLLIIGLVGLIFFGGFAKGKWY